MASLVGVKDTPLISKPRGSVTTMSLLLLTNLAVKPVLANAPLRLSKNWGIESEAATST